MSAATILSEAYGEAACLYETVLGVDRRASPSQLRKAYYKKCLRYHPDKLSPNLSNDEKDLARKKFQATSLAYTILSDDEKRREYDDSGILYEDDDDLSAGKSGMKQWTEYFNSIFPKVTAADIDAFEVKYKCSDEEEEDVLKYYTQFKGDLNKMVECVMLSSDADKQRWVKDYIEPAIESGTVNDHMAKIRKTVCPAPAKKRKTKGSTKKKRVKRPEMHEKSDGNTESDPQAEIINEETDVDNDVAKAKENNNSSNETKQSSKAALAKKKSPASKASKPSKKASSSSSVDVDLIAQIRGNALARREAGFDSLMAGLEDRYGGSRGKKISGKKKLQQRGDDLDDDEFAKIQAKLMKNKKSQKFN